MMVFFTLNKKIAHKFIFAFTLIPLIGLGQKVGFLSRQAFVAQGLHAEIDAMDVVNIALGEKKPKNLSKNRKSPNDSICKMISILPSVNYTPPTSWSFGGNVFVSFYGGHKDSTYLSTVNLAATYTLNKQVILVSRPTIWTNKNNYFFSGDYRYAKYPSYTYGLGASSLENKVLIDYSYVRFYQTFYKRIFQSFFLGLGYNLDYHYDITEYAGGKITDFQKYSNRPKTQSTSSGVTINALYDTRKNSHNPIPGAYYFNLSYRYNAKLLKSDQNWQSMIVDFRKYLQFSPNSSNVLAIWSYNWFTFAGNPPYLHLPSSAWDTYENMSRGYTQGRFRSRSLMDLETEYRFSISRNKLFGGVVFSSVQTIAEKNGGLFKVFYPAAGTGLRIKLNKKTNTNIAVDYALGLDGSSGFFFNLGEVF